jgi:fructose-1,6-bisphosphatase/inositol monophosphatase family enzyme
MQNTPHPSDFVRAIAPSVTRAAEIVRELEGQVANHPKAGESSDIKAALTVADTVAQETILAAVLEHFPGVCLRAEEDTPLVSRFPARADATVVLDPIDGTLRSYLQRGGPYGVMVGLAVAQEYEAALVALPHERFEFQATRGGGAFVATAGDGVSRPAVLDGSGKRILVSYDLPEATAGILRERGYETIPACGGAISVAPLIPGVCAGLRIATNRPANVSIRGRIGALIVREAGATLLCETGAPFPSDIETPARVLIVGSDPADLEALLEAVAAANL